MHVSCTDLAVRGNTAFQKAWPVIEGEVVSAVEPDCAQEPAIV
jgi:hypothetical protein